jgi:excisionase family DNA binding protein
MGRPKSRIDDAIAQGYVGTKDAAAMIGVSVSTIQKMVAAGRLDAWRTTGGHRRIALASLQREIARLPDPHPVVPGRPMTVLIVEDNPVALAEYRILFRQWGEQVQVQHAGDGAEALLRLAQQRPDVLITDLVMQPFDGHTLIRTLRANPLLATLHVVVVTGVEPGAVAFDGRTVVYRKPLSLERLAGYVDARLQDHALRSAQAVAPRP